MTLNYYLNCLSSRQSSGVNESNQTCTVNVAKNEDPLFPKEFFSHLFEPVSSLYEQALPHFFTFQIVRSSCIDTNSLLNSSKSAKCFTTNSCLLHHFSQAAVLTRYHDLNLHRPLVQSFWVYIYKQLLVQNW